MSLEANVMERLKQAMRDKNEAALRTLRAIKAAILVEKTAAGSTGELKEADEIKLLQKLAKQRKDSLEIFRTQNREDLATKEAEEITIIEQFLPQQLSPEEIDLAVKAAISDLGASGAGDMGKVMGVVTKSLAGKADGKAISAAVKKNLDA